MSGCYDTEDVFDMIEDNNDEFTMQEIIPGPGVAPGGYTGMVLKKKSDANYDTEWDYQESGGILLTGQCETYNDLPADPEQGEAWAVGEEAPYECYAWFGEWIDLGEIFPSGVSPAVTMTAITGGTRLTITDAQHPDGQSTDIMNGPKGDDGYSPEVTMTEITGGTRLTITDAQHPDGQSSDIMNGAAGPGVASGGSAGQYLKKASGTDFDTTWDTLGADDVGYDGSQNYAAGTAGKQIKDLGAELTLAEDSVTPYVVGDTNTTGSTLNPGTFVWVKNHSVLSDGLYTVKTTAIVSGGSVVDTNMEHVDAGGLNDLRNTLIYQAGTITPVTGGYWVHGGSNSKVGKIGNVGFLIFTTRSADSEVPHGGVNYTKVATISFLPKFEVVERFVNNNGVIFGLRINTSGDVLVYNYGSSDAKMIDGALVLCFPIA